MLVDLRPGLALVHRHLAPRLHAGLRVARVDVVAEHAGAHHAVCGRDPSRSCRPSCRPSDRSTEPPPVSIITRCHFFALASYVMYESILNLLLALAESNDVVDPPLLDLELRLHRAGHVDHGLHVRAERLALALHVPAISSPCRRSRPAAFMSYMSFASVCRRGRRAASRRFCAIGHHRRDRPAPPLRSRPSSSSNLPPQSARTILGRARVSIDVIPRSRFILARRLPVAHPRRRPGGRAAADSSRTAGAGAASPRRSDVNRPRTKLLAIDWAMPDDAARRCGSRSRRPATTGDAKLDEIPDVPAADDARSRAARRRQLRVQLAAARLWQRRSICPRRRRPRR